MPRFNHAKRRLTKRRNRPKQSRVAASTHRGPKETVHTSVVGQKTIHRETMGGIVRRNTKGRGASVGVVRTGRAVIGQGRIERSGKAPRGMDPDTLERMVDMVFAPSRKQRRTRKRTATPRTVASESAVDNNATAEAPLVAKEPVETATEEVLAEAAVAVAAAMELSEEVEALTAEVAEAQPARDASAEPPAVEAEEPVQGEVPAAAAAASLRQPQQSHARLPGGTDLLPVEGYWSESQNDPYELPSGWPALEADCDIGRIAEELESLATRQREAATAHRALTLDAALTSQEIELLLRDQNTWGLAVEVLRAEIPQIAQIPWQPGSPASPAGESEVTATPDDNPLEIAEGPEPRFPEESGDSTEAEPPAAPCDPAEGGGELEDATYIDEVVGETIAEETAEEQAVVDDTPAVGSEPEDAAPVAEPAEIALESSDSEAAEPEPAPPDEPEEPDDVPPTVEGDALDTNEQLSADEDAVPEEPGPAEEPTELETADGVEAETDGMLAAEEEPDPPAEAMAEELPDAEAAAPQSSDVAEEAPAEEAPTVAEPSAATDEVEAGEPAATPETVATEDQPGEQPEDILLAEPAPDDGPADAEPEPVVAEEEQAAIAAEFKTDVPADPLPSGSNLEGALEAITERVTGIVQPLSELAPSVEGIRQRVEANAAATVALASTVERLHHNVEQVDRKAQAAPVASPASPSATFDLGDPWTPALMGFGLVAASWGVTFYIKTGNLGLALSGLVVANLLGCALLWRHKWFKASGA